MRQHESNVDATLLAILSHCGVFLSFFFFANKLRKIVLRQTDIYIQ